MENRDKEFRGALPFLNAILLTNKIAYYQYKTADYKLKKKTFFLFELITSN